MNSLPLELEWIIVLHLDVTSLGRLAQVSTHFYHLIRDQRFWRAKCNRDYGLPHLTIDNWFDWYRQTHRDAQEFRQKLQVSGEIDIWIDWYYQKVRASKWIQNWRVAEWAVRYAGATFKRLSQFIKTTPYQLQPAIYRLYREILSFDPMVDFKESNFYCCWTQPKQFRFPVWIYSMEVCKSDIVRQWFQARNLAVDNYFNRVMFYGCRVPQSNQAEIWFPLSRQRPEVQRQKIPPDVDLETLSFKERYELESPKFDQWVENIRYDYI